MSKNMREKKKCSWVFWIGMDVANPILCNPILSADESGDSSANWIVVWSSGEFGTQGVSIPGFDTRCGRFPVLVEDDYEPWRFRNG